MYTTGSQLPLALAQLVKRQLAEIGLEVEVKGLRSTRRRRVLLEAREPR